MISKSKSLLLLSIIFLFTFLGNVFVYAESEKRYVYDEAKLLTEKEKQALQSLAIKTGQKREIDFIILTVNGTNNKSLKKYVQDFYDENALGFDKEFGNTAIVAIDMKERDVYLAGFGKAKEYLHDVRLDTIRSEITADLTDAHYSQAFSQFITLSDYYMGYEPDVNPDSIFHIWWFQLIIALVLATIIVTIMLYRSGGKVTVSGQTYMNKNTSKIIQQRDTFINKTVTKTKKPSNDNNGGTTSGGHSHSGSGGKF